MSNPPRRLAAVLAIVGSAGCLSIDEPNPIAPPGTSQTVRWLSLLGMFDDLKGQVPAAGVVAYQPNAALYSDGAEKRRFVYVPPGEPIHVGEDRWELPVGAYLIKTFSFPVDARHPEAGERLVETRFLVRERDGFKASTYVWNAEQTDAEVSGGNVNVPIETIDLAGVAWSGSFHVPGTSQCQGCHWDRALGLRSGELDRPGTFADGTTNQIEHLIAAGVLDAVPRDRTPWVDPFGSAPLELRARAYLGANCGHCHSRDGDEEATANGVMWDYPETTADKLPICKLTKSVDGRNRVIVPGHPERSEMIARMWSTDAFVRMPRGSSHVADGRGIAVLTEWIANMPEQECK